MRESRPTPGVILAITLASLTIVIGAFVIGYALGEDEGPGVVVSSNDTVATQPPATPSVDDPAADPSTDDHAAGVGNDEHPDADEHETAREHVAVASEGDDVIVQVTMTEFGYELSRSELPVGTPITFEFENVGAIEHEAMIGTAHMQEEFAETAAGNGHDHGDAHHGDIDAITLGPGESGSLSVTFHESGAWLLGCHLPGHWDAGMTTTMQVT